VAELREHCEPQSVSVLQEEHDEHDTETTDVRTSVAGDILAPSVGHSRLRRHAASDRGQFTRRSRAHVELDADTGTAGSRRRSYIEQADDPEH